MRSYTKPAVFVLTGLSIACALAGCTAPASTDGTTTDDSTTSTGSGSYTDGTYTASGDYQAPSGTETVEVSITLAANSITAVEVVGDATDPQAKLMQGEFIGGIGGVVVGKNIDSIQVDKVGGSSLTSGGFNAAIDAIKADAEA